MAHVVVPVSLYQRVFQALIGLTIVTVIVSMIDLGQWNPLVALAIAVVKASLVVLFFMGLRWAGRLTWVALGVALAGVLILFGASLNDDLTRGTKTFLPAEIRPEIRDFAVQGLNGLTPEVTPPTLPPEQAERR